MISSRLSSLGILKVNCPFSVSVSICSCRGGGEKHTGKGDRETVTEDLGRNTVEGDRESVEEDMERTTVEGDRESVDEKV